MISIIAAVAGNGVIGKNNLLPWHIPEDMQLFRQLTMGKPVIVGRRTFESLPNALDGRFLVVLSRNPNFFTSSDTSRVARSIPEALKIAHQMAQMPKFPHLAQFEEPTSTRPRRTQRYVEGEAELVTKKWAKPLAGEAARKSPASPGFSAASAEILVAGGETVYEQFLPLADRLYISHITGTHDGDAFFPQVRYRNWTPQQTTRYQQFSFITYERAQTNQPA